MLDAYMGVIVGVIVPVDPPATKVIVVGERAIAVISAGCVIMTTLMTVTRHVALLPPTDAVIVAVPAAIGVTIPFDTAAAAVLSDDQMILPAALDGSIVAIIVPADPPTVKVIAGVMEIELTLSTSLT